MREFTAAGHRKPTVEVPSYSSPLTEQESAFLQSNFDPTIVTLDTLKDNYVMVKNLVGMIMNNR